MDDNTLKIISQYLNIDTNYAVIINGPYGIGKTYYFKNVLGPAINKIKLPKDNRKQFTAIHISLFGLKSLEEIQTEIFVSLYPILKHKGLKLAAGIGKSIIRGIAQINKLGDIDKYIADNEIKADKWLSYDELVICFDDIDRKSDSLNLKDVFGFINSIVENLGAKVLIIANEQQLINDKDYSVEVREKVIGVSIQFAPDTETVYREIIKSKYSTADKIYFKFLAENENKIADVIKLNQNNFRNLIFFLEHFKNIFYSLQTIFSTDKSFLPYKDEKLEAILNFTLAIAIEYKLGRLNSTNLEAIEKLDTSPFAGLKFDFGETKDKKDAKEIVESYDEIFKKKYFSKNKYYFFASIFDYIIGKKAFEIDLLKQELENYFVAKDGKISKQDEVLNKLGYIHCLDIPDGNYRTLTNEMLDHVDKGKYNLQQYSTVFHFATRFNNLLGFNIEKLKKRFKKGIPKGISNSKYVGNLSFYMSVSHDTEFKEHVIEIAKYCLDINESLKEKKEEDDIKELFKIFSKNHEKFIETVYERNSEYRYTPFWLEIDLKKICAQINKLSNTQIWKLGHYFTDRYRVSIYEKLFPEKDFVIKLRELIDSPTKSRKRKTLRNASFDYLSKCLSECENNFPITE